MKLGKDKTKIINYIKQSLDNPTLEFESRITNKISQAQFNDIIKRIKGLPYVKFISNQDSLDIFYQYTQNKTSNIRVSVNGIESIKKYCKTNDIKNIKNVEFIKKSISQNSEGNKNYPIDIKDYNLRFNLKREIPVKKDSQDGKSVFSVWKSALKEFRYKKRFSYKTIDGLFRFDLTIVKNNIQKKIVGELQRLKKKDVRENQVKFVNVPSFVKDFRGWYDGLKDNDIVELKGRISHKNIPTKTLQESKTLTNPMSYEIEIEYIGNKLSEEEKKMLLGEIKGDLDPKDQISLNVFNKLIKHCGTILQSLQKSYYIISESEKRLVLDQYKILMDSTMFKGPHNVTLELKHIVPKRYEDYQNVLTIRRNYSVTDKADGERNLLIALDDGSLYLMNRKNTIKTLGAKAPSLKNSIFDGEYIKKDKIGNNINLFMVFDVYYYNNEDTRFRKFTKETDSKETSKTRHEIMKSSLTDLALEVPEGNNLSIKLKKFYYSDIDEYKPEVNKQITDFEDQLKTLEEGSAKYIQVQKNINILKSDQKIFLEASKVYNKDYIYHIDGLIFTPIFLGVGETYGSKDQKFDGRWNESFKWKPSEENTIDFQVHIRKDDSMKHVIEYANENGLFKSYKTIDLLVGYNPKVHTKHNPCRIFNENVVYEDKYSYVPFIPTNPYRKESQFACIELDVNGNMRTQDKNLITDGCIIECKYDQNKNGGFRWVPIRVRDTNKPNDFTTAKNVWNTIFNPVTTDMITTGKFDIELTDEVYYSKNIKRKDISTKEMNDFHSYVKKSIITKNTNPGDNLLDISCGRAGDLNHWVDSKLNSVVGIDLNRENLDGMNGACNRMLNDFERIQESVNQLLFVWGDSSFELMNGSAAKDELNKYYLDIIYGNIDQTTITNDKLKKFYNIGNVNNGNGFNVVSCQFSFHYFFENMDKLDSVLRNISDSLKVGGVFIGTTLDGNMVFNALKNKNSIMEHKNDKLLWKITKKYDQENFDVDENSLGYKIDVYMDSIGKTNMEYLVNYEYLDSILERYNLKMKSTITFSDLFVELNSNKEAYGDALKMSEELKKYSFLNKCFIIEKI